MRLLVGTVAVVVLALAGCAGGPEVTEATGDTKAAKPSADAPTDKEVEAYFENMNSNDPERMEEAIDAAAPDSIAAAYAAYHLHIFDSWMDAGLPWEPNTLDKTPEGFESCYPYPEELPPGEDPCVLWSDIKSEDGRVASFTVGGKDISDRLSVGDGKKVKTSLGSVEFLSAYQSVQANTLFVSLRVKSKAKTLASMFHVATYRAPSGRQTKASDLATTAPDEISPDSSSYVTIGFDRAKPGGMVRLELIDDSFYIERTVKIKTR